MSKINLKKKFDLFSDQWSPKIIAQMNDYHFKLAKIQGDFVWHTHDDTDEVFIVIDGQMQLDLEDDSIQLQAGEMFVVPKGKSHKPYAEREAQIMLIEPAVTVNTGEIGHEKTVEDPKWI